jgi:hypothetical protein
MKTMIGTLSCLMLWAVLGALPAWSDTVAILSIQPNAKAVAAGDVFGLAVNITDVSDLFAFQFDLGFAPAVLSSTSITEGLFLFGGGSTFFIPGTIDNVSGAIIATADTLIGTISGVSGSGTLAEVQFTTLAPGTSSVTLSNVQLLDSSLSPIAFTTAEGKVDVVPEPSTMLLFGSCLLGLAAAWRKRGGAVWGRT